MKPTKGAGTKSTKKPDDFKGLTPGIRVHLDFYDKDANSNKFWYCEVFSVEGKHYVVRRWGRNGTQGQSMVEEFDYASTAAAFAEKLEQKKRDEGYQNDPSLLVKIAREVEDEP